MSVARYFTPGRTSPFQNFATDENLFKKGSQYPCSCKNIDKFLPGFDGYANMSNQLRVASLIRTTRGGRLGYGNYNNGGNVGVNYLGRVEGQSGGGGAPIRNKF